MTALDERRWWDTLPPSEIENNLHGSPPYDVEAAAAYIVEKLPLREFHRWLDLGCGVGRLTRVVARFVPTIEITGVDISPRLIARATMANDPCPGGHVIYRNGDGRTLPERCGMFDAAYSVTLFQHLPHDAVQGYLNEVSDHLRPGGRFLFTVSEGEEDAFLSHQVDLDRVDEWMEDAGMAMVWCQRNGIVEGWTWVMGMMPLAEMTDG